jgi:excisionase family DNA binding protein
MPNENKEYRGVDEIAKRYGFSKDTTRKFLVSGTIPAVRFGREWRTTERVVVESMEARIKK